jgi:class 3 adenylate cyclase
MSEIVFRFGGTLDKMIGDSIMVFFGDPNSRGKKNDALSCVCMAIAMKEAMSNLQKRWKIAGIETPPSVRMGINTGKCRVGNFGTENKLDYTVLGSTVNLASHLESIARANEILITEETYNLVKDHVQCTVNHSADSRWLSKDLKLYSADKMTSGIENSTSLSNFIDNP